MNNIQEIILDLDKDLPKYTIASATKVKAKYIRQTSSIDCFAIANLEVRPYGNKEIAVFNNQILEIDVGYAVLYPQQNSDRDTIETLNTICQGVIEGIKKACLDLDKKPYLIGGIEAIVTDALYHPVDSRPQCYEIAVCSALLKVFERVDLIKL